MLDKVNSMKNELTIPKVLALSSVGTTIEWYDFLLAATAAVVIWPHLFVASNIAPSLALALSIASVGIPYLSRPVGAYLFGHHGDKFGRKNALVFTLATMGIGTLGLALLPGAASIGIAALVLLYIFRLVQGLGMGGEVGGATTFVAEYAARVKNRGFLEGILGSTVSWGVIASTGAIALASLLLPHAAFISWGWRVLFLIGVAVLVFGAVFRYKFLDTPLFNMLQRERKLESQPALQSLRKHWKQITAFSLGVATIGYVAVGITISFVQSFLITHGHYTSLFANSTVMLTYLLFGASAIIGGVISDRIHSRKKIALIGLVLSLIWLYPYFALVNTNAFASILVAVSVLGIVLGFGYSTFYVWLAESFPTKYRYSGTGLSYQIGTLIAGLLVVFAYPVILVYGGSTSFLYVVMIGVVLAVISIIATALIKDTDPEKELMV